jgi:hypothetical protein
MLRRLVFFALVFGVLVMSLAAVAQNVVATPPAITTAATVSTTGEANSNPVQFLPVPPCRVVDTRQPNGPLGGPPIQGGTFRSFPIPQGNCNISSTAAAYSLNVTVVPHGSLMYLTVWPTGLPRPITTILNSLDGRIKSDAAIVAAGTGEAISVYASDTTDVIVDINGYFAPLPNQFALAFYPLTPCRVVDTRNPNGPLGGPYLQGGQPREFPLLQSPCNIPASVRAYSLNAAVLPRNGGALAYLTVWPAGQPQPVVSTLTDLTGTIVSNAAIVPAGAGGDVDAYASNDTDLVIDINGYFAAPGAGGLSLYTVPPCRALDTRNLFLGFSGLLRVPILGISGNPCGLSVRAQAVVFNATVFPHGALNYLTLWKNGQPQPMTWTLNAVDGAVTSNMAIVGTANVSIPSIDAYASGFTQLVLDTSGYFGP